MVPADGGWGRSIELPTRFAVEIFFVLRVAQVKKAKDFFSDELPTKARTWKPLSSARAGLSPQEGDLEKVQEKKKTKEGEKVAPRRKGSVCSQPRNFFFWFTSFWVLRDPSRL